MKQYVNFHAHSTSSLLDGMSKFDEYAARAKTLNQPAICFTEHGNLHGLLNAYEAAKEADIPYFPGIEFYQARKTRFDMDPEEKSGKESEEWQQRGPYHLGAVAYNNAGYHNLIKLSSRAFTEGWYGKPRVDHELLSEHSEGLVLLSGCLSGEIQQALLRDDYTFALKTASTLQDIVGKDNFFIEMQNHFIEEELRNHEHLKSIAKAIGAPIIASCDSHYTCKEHSHSHDVMLCVNTKSRIDTPNRFKFSGDHFYLKSYSEMAELFPEEYLDNTLLIAEKYDINLSFGEYHIPSFAVPQGETQESFFLKSIEEGATKRFGFDWKANTKVVERIEYETQVIREMGFPNYFLIVADLVNWAKENKIMCGAGRGSVAGSLVAYCLGITQVDSLKHELPFERFLVPGRKGLPDIDLDFDDRYRERVIEYARQTYGYDHTAQIGTFSEIGAKSAIKDIARVLNYPFEFGQKVNDAIPPATFGVAKTLSEALESSTFKELYENDEDVHKVVDLAKQYEGLWRQTGMHAAGLIISDKPVTDYIPVLQKGKDKPIISQWDMGQIDKCGMLKVDFLGLRNLSIVDITLQHMLDSYNIELEEPYKLVDEDDPLVYEALGRGENIGVFQMESPGMRQLMVGMKPSNISDVSALLALYRPGPMGSNVHNEYVERKHKRKPVTYLHPSLKPILGETYGLLLYQEQLLRIAVEVAGFTISEADDLRKVVGKKIVKDMPKHRKHFVEGCIATSNMPESIANQLFSEIEHHASYSFSKNHAVAYGYTSYLTSYLRTHYPIEFMASALSSIYTNQERLRLYLNESKTMGFNIVAPSINHSKPGFSVVGDSDIVYGFNAIKGVGEVLSKKLGEVKEVSNYTNLYDFMRKAGADILSRDVIKHFLGAGCFDELLMEMPVEVPALDRTEKMQVLYDEFEELGVFITDHPFNDVEDLIEGKTTHTIDQIKYTYTGERIKVAGVVTSIEKKMTKAGNKMYHMTIDDLNGSIPVSITPRVAAKMPEPPFVKGDIVVIQGKIDRFGDEEDQAVSIMCYEGEKLDDSHLIGGKSILLKTNHPLSYEQLERINDIIEGTKGNSPVYLEFRDKNNQVRIKFNSLTSKDIEQTLQSIVEVSL